MSCNNCNCEVSDNTNFCPKCGYRIEQMQNYQTYGSTVNNVNLQNTAVSNMLYKDFFKSYTKKSVNVINVILGVLCFVSAALEIGSTLSIINYITTQIVVFVVFEVGLFVILGILLLIYKKWNISLILTILSGMILILGMILYGKPINFLIFILALINTISLYKVKKAYNFYNQTGQTPMKLIG